MWMSSVYPSGFAVAATCSANLSGCARFGLDHARLLEDRLQDSGERTCDDVGGATGGNGLIKVMACDG